MQLGCVIFIGLVFTLCTVASASTGRDQRARGLEQTVTGLSPETLRVLNRIARTGSADVISWFLMPDEARPEFRSRFRVNEIPTIGALIRLRRVLLHYFTQSSSVFADIQEHLPHPLRMGMTEQEIEKYLETGTLPVILPTAALLENLEITPALSSRLFREGHRTIADLVAFDVDELATFPQIGFVGAQNILSELVRHGHHFMGGYDIRPLIQMDRRVFSRAMNSARNRRFAVRDAVMGNGGLYDLLELPERDQSYLQRLGITNVEGLIGFWQQQKASLQSGGVLTSEEVFLRLDSFVAHLIRLASEFRQSEQIGSNSWGRSSPLTCVHFFRRAPGM